MALTTSFTVSQSALAPGTITCNDTSTGTDVLVVSRKIFVRTAYGEYLTGNGTVNYDVWSIADASISLDILTEDTACEITVEWCNSGGTALYTLTQVFCCPQFNKNFFYYLIQQQALTPSIIQDTNYFNNMATYWMNITGAIQAVELGADISASQNCLDAATNMMNNQNLYF